MKGVVLNDKGQMTVDKQAVKTTADLSNRENKGKWIR